MLKRNKKKNIIQNHTRPIYTNMFYKISADKINPLLNYHTKSLVNNSCTPLSCMQDLSKFKVARTISQVLSPCFPLSMRALLWGYF